MEEKKELDFHNSIPIKGKELKEAKIKALTQQDQILGIFKREPDRWFTPYDIQSICGNDSSQPTLRYMLITSIRRSITNLTDAGYLVKGSRGIQIREQWGMNNNRWRYRDGSL